MRLSVCSTKNEDTKNPFMVHPNVEHSSMNSSRAIFDHVLSNITGDIVFLTTLVILRASTPDMGGDVSVDILRYLIVIISP